jgi:hypothetical protein
MYPIDFDAIKGAALQIAHSLLPELLPGGRFEGNEYVVRNPRHNDRSPGSFKINSKTGIWKDFATDEGGADLIALGARPDRHRGRAFVARWPPQAAFAWVKSFRRLWVVQIMAHSARTFLTPHNRNWRKPRACLICPNTGSTTCFLNR